MIFFNRHIKNIAVVRIKANSFHRDIIQFATTHNDVHLLVDYGQVFHKWDDLGIPIFFYCILHVKLPQHGFLHEFVLYNLNEARMTRAESLMGKISKPIRYTAHFDPKNNPHGKCSALTYWEIHNFLTLDGSGAIPNFIHETI